MTHVLVTPIVYDTTTCLNIPGLGLSNTGSVVLDTDRPNWSYIYNDDDDDDDDDGSAASVDDDDDDDDKPNTIL